MSTMLTTVVSRQAATDVAPKKKGSARREALLSLAFLWLYALLSLSPLLFIAFGSVRSTPDLLADPVGLPSSPTASNFITAWVDGNFGRYMINSLLVTSVAVALCTAVSIMAAYVLGRWTFRGHRLLVAFFLSGLMLPIKLGAVPIYQLFDRFGLIDSHASLILVYTATGIPLAVFIGTAFFRQMPAELEEAARIDGASEFRIFWSILLPLAVPAMATIAAITSVQSWHEFFFPLVLLRDPEKFTITIGMSNFVGQYNMDIGPLYAGLVLAAAPLLALFVLASRQIVTGLTAGIGR